MRCVASITILPPFSSAIAAISAPLPSSVSLSTPLILSYLTASNPDDISATAAEEISRLNSPDWSVLTWLSPTTTGRSGTGVVSIRTTPFITTSGGGTGVSVAVGVSVGVGVLVAVGVSVGVSVGVDVGETVGVSVAVLVGVFVGVSVGVLVAV
jgi:hypothetical protein